MDTAFGNRLDCKCPATPHTACQRRLPSESLFSLLETREAIEVDCADFVPVGCARGTIRIGESVLVGGSSLTKGSAEVVHRVRQLQ